MGKIVSKTVERMIEYGERNTALTDSEKIIALFEESNLPWSEKIIEFQQRYGGLKYRIGESYYVGFRLDLFFFNEHKNEYSLYYVHEDDGLYYYNCMDYLYSGDVGPCINIEGQIFYFGMGQVFITADSIEEFLEDEAIKFDFTYENRNWFTTTLNKELVDEIRHFQEFNRIENSNFSYKYFEWWVNKDSSVYIRINLADDRNYAKIYYSDRNYLTRFLKGIKRLIHYPRFKLEDL